MSQAERNPQILEEFKRRRSVQWKITIGVVCSAFLLAMAQEQLRQWNLQAYERPAMVLILSLIAMCVFLTFRNWRCPGCQRYLGKNLNPRFCPGCGIPLQ